MTGSLSMVMLDQTVVTVALPSMTHDLPLTASGQQWVINAYVLALAALVAFGGKLGDILGGVTTYRAGVVLFFLASLGCGLTPTGSTGQAMLIGCRALQGVGAAMMMPASAAIVMAVFAPAERGRAMAIYAGISQVFLAVGPLLGGFLTEYVSWRAVFFLNVPVGITALLLVHFAHPPNLRQPGQRIRPLDTVLIVAGLGLTVFAVQQSSDWGWTAPATLIALTSGVLLTAVFVLLQLRSRDPLIQVRLFARRAFLGDTAVMGLLQFGLLAVVLFSTLYLQDLLHFSPMQSGLAALPLILPITLAAQLGGRWFDRAGVRPPVLTGLSISLAGLVCWTATLPSLTYDWQIPGMILTGLGLGLTISPTMTDGLSRVGAEQRGQASGLIQTVRQLGGTFGVAVIGAVILSRTAGFGSQNPELFADAVTVGFAIAAGVFALALVAGWILLGRTRAVPAEAQGAGHNTMVA
jgi:EmrB/QacA subfamily drug resistance transporter